MPSPLLAWVLIAVAWIAFGVIVVVVQGRDQERLEEPRVQGPAEPGDPPLLEAAA